MKNLFPSLVNARWGRLSLDDQAQISGRELDLTDSLVCESWVQQIHKAKGFDYSYGGFKENREFFLRQHYNKDEKLFVHLGTDYNVPADVDVALLDDARVIHVMKSKDQNGGWGRRVIFQLANDRYLICGHLAHHINVKEGDQCRSGIIIGKTGKISENGGWWPHLHVQEIDVFFLRQIPDLEKIDGYLPVGHSLLNHVYNSELRIQF